MKRKRRVVIQADSTMEAANMLKKLGTYECSKHGATTTYEPIQTFANGEAVTLVEGCCDDAIHAVARAVNPRR